MSRVLAIVLVILVSACSVLDSALTKEYKSLVAEKAASKTAEAEELYSKAEAFLSRVERTANAPEGLLADARALKQKRARELARTVAFDFSVAGAKKALDALKGANLNAETEARAAGIDLTKAGASAPVRSEEWLKNADPYSDTIPARKGVVK